MEAKRIVFRANSLTRDELEAWANEISQKVARNAGVAEQLCFPHIYLGLIDIFSEPPAPGPLVANTENTALMNAAIMKLVDAQYLNGSIRLMWENNKGERMLTDVCKRFADGILKAAGQVAPQATDADLREMVQQFYTLNACRMTDEDIEGDPRMKRARALLATPPTSKAQSDRLPSEIMAALRDADDESALTFSAKEMRTAMNLWNSERFMRTSLQERLDARTVTSKADTGEIIREAVNAGLEMAADACEKLNHEAAEFQRPNGISCARAIRALKSATPSTIKPDHINDAVEMVAAINAEPTGEQL